VENLNQNEMTNEEIQKELDKLPDLYFSDVKMPENLEGFWGKYYEINSNHNTKNESGKIECGRNSIRSFSEIYQIIKSKYKVSFEEFIDSFLEFRCGNLRNPGVAISACKDINKVTFYSSALNYYKDSEYDNVKNETESIIVTDKDFYRKECSFDNNFSELEKGIYYLMREKVGNL
jgi:hypothetical protein